MIDGTLPKGRVVVLRWESMEALKAWRYSPEHMAARKIGVLLREVQRRRC